MKRYKDVLLYIVFGLLTTAVNVIAYWLCYDILGFINTLSVALAWFISVAFAYITNKLFVFQSKSFEKSILKKEIFSFFACRIITGVLDIAIMYIAVDIMSGNSYLWKLISNILVIILNFLASKIFIFRKK